MPDNKDDDYILLRINLTTQNCTKSSIPNKLLKNYIGGKGFGSKMLLEEIGPKIDPLGPHSKMIFVSGPVTATNFPTANRYGILYKSPLTGTYAESYSGGGVVQRMRGAGYFAIIIEGVCKNPSYLLITEKGVEFKSAQYLWGSDTWTTYQSLIKEITENTNEKTKKSTPDILCIGPAGENLVKIANIQNNLYHSAGRCGPGAVFGSKKLKAIVFSGNKRPLLNKKPEFKQVIKKVYTEIQNLPEIYGKEGLYRKFGTPSIVDWANEIGCFPTRYFSAGFSEHSKNFNAETLNSTILKKRTGCWNCTFTCGKLVEIEAGPFKSSIEGPEYETIAAFGGFCDIHDLAAIVKINEYCDKMGIDTISAGSLSALAIESNKRGKIPPDLDLSLDYNDPHGVLTFLDDMVKRKGIGDDFSQGSKYVTKKYGLEDFAMHVKGLDFAGYDPRAFRGFALSYGVSPEGPTHLRSVFHGIERKMPDRLSYKNKVVKMIEQEDKMAIIDSLIVCKFLRNALSWEILVEIYKSIFDQEIDITGLRKIAGKMVNMSRMFNMREGFSRKDDYLPNRVYKESINDPAGNSMILDKKKYEDMLEEYYLLRGWSKHGIPPNDM